jgi:hypothetical protein
VPAVIRPKCCRDAARVRRCVFLSCASLVLVLTLGCNGTEKPTGASTPTADGGVVALIRVSVSTNAAETDVIVYSDGSVNRTIGPARGALDGTPAMFPPGQPATAAETGLAADCDALATGSPQTAFDGG